MKKYLLLFMVSLMLPSLSQAQTTDPMVSKCAMSAGPEYHIPEGLQGSTWKGKSPERTKV